MIEVTQEQVQVPRHLINHYQQWLQFEVTRDSCYIRPIMEGGNRIEVSPLPFILNEKAVKEEIKRSWIGPMATAQGPVFLFPKKTLQPTDEGEF